MLSVLRMIGIILIVVPLLLTFLGVIFFIKLKKDKGLIIITVFNGLYYIFWGGLLIIKYF